MSAPTEKLKDLITYLACSLVDDPDQVEVQAIEEDDTWVIELSVGPDDLGKVIGRDGRTARAMRTLLSSLASTLDVNAVLDILE